MSVLSRVTGSMADETTPCADVRAFLLGVPKVVVGFRNREGILETCRTFKTQDLPALAQGKVREPSAREAPHADPQCPFCS